MRFILPAHPLIYPEPTFLYVSLCYNEKQSTALKNPFFRNNFNTKIIFLMQKLLVGIVKNNKNYVEGNLLAFPILSELKTFTKKYFHHRNKFKILLMKMLTNILFYPVPWVT